MISGKLYGPGVDSISDAIRQQGVGAATILHVALPEINRQMEALLVALDQCEPQLEKLLELRAELRVIRRFRKGLLDKIRVAGLDADQAR
jgi:hypothetical protein